MTDCSKRPRLLIRDHRLYIKDGSSHRGSPLSVLTATMLHSIKPETVDRVKVSGLFSVAIRKKADKKLKLGLLSFFLYSLCLGCEDSMPLNYITDTCQHGCHCVVTENRDHNGFLKTSGVLFVFLCLFILFVLLSY